MTYIHPDAAKALKRYAVENNCKVHDICLEALENWFRAHGSARESQGRAAEDGRIGQGRGLVPLAADADEAAEKRICSTCIGDGYLTAKVRREGVIATCDYCKTEGPTISIGDFADLTHAVFDTYFERTASEPEGVDAIAHNDPEGGYNWEREGDPASELIQEFAGVDDEPANDTRVVLEDRHNNFDDWSEEQEYGEDACYTEKTIFAERFHFRWLEFERSLRTEARLFNKAARELFDDIFAGITQHVTRTGAPIVVAAGPGTAITEFYRARVFRPGRPVTDAIMHPDRSIGPPPISDATPGRMNARGISVFYGATAPNVALAEVRPPVGSRVVVAKFQILRPLKLFAIKELESIYADGSRFDPEHLGRVERAKFLGRISYLISAPVMPSDDGFDYIVTQAIAEYLANEAGADLGGLLFPSVQTGDSSLNVVLFHKASRVQVRIPLGEIEAHNDAMGPDGLEEEYYVRETIDPDAKEPKNPAKWRARYAQPEDMDERPETLAVSTSTLHVHEVKAVRFSTIDYKVSWHIAERKKLKF